MDDSPAPVSVATDVSRRRSGRVSKKPDLVASQIGFTTKRKRVASDTRDASEDVDDDVDMQDEDDVSSSEPDDSQDEDVRPAKKRARKAASSKPRAKKPKQNGDAVSLSIRPAKKSRPTKSRPPKAGRFVVPEDAEGLFAEVFSNPKNLENVCAEWIARVNDDEIPAVAELLTFTVRCSGCDHTVDPSTVDDPDSFKSRVQDIQEQYQAQNVSDYPLISRVRGTAAFRQTLRDFLRTLVLTLDKADILFEQREVMEILESWVSVLASTGHRPLRHTATVICLGVVSALCEVGADLLTQNAQAQRQLDGERKKGQGTNKKRLEEMELAKRRIEAQEKLLQEFLMNWFDGVFIHRYRDVDPHIRLDCMQALGEWILTYEYFLEGQFLRYLGWLMSDTHAPTRLEVLKAMSNLYKDPSKHLGLEGFTEKFKPRMTEMAARDEDPTVRACAIEILNILREAQFLEPTDIDEIGQLIFDSEAKVRKAVTPFVVANVNDAYEAIIDETLGGQEGLEEVFGDELPDPDEYDSPRIEWLKIKSLVEQLESYDAQVELGPAQAVQVPDTDSYMLQIVPGMESRFSLAAEGLCELIPELQWELLAGYLLYDHSEVSNGTANGTTPSSQFHDLVRLTSEEEILLLEVLNTSVRLSLGGAASKLQDKSRRLTKAQRLEEEELLEAGARHLTTLIPRLLSKFGAIPEAASSILRLEHVLNVSTYDYAAYSTLLEDIKKQFLSHAKPRVLEEASLALLHAKGTADINELAQDQLSSIAEDAVAKLNLLAKGGTLGSRGSLTLEHLEVLVGIVTRLEMLGQIEDISDILEVPPTDSRKKASGDAPVDHLLSILDRGLPSSETDEDVDVQEDNVAKHACRALVFYFMWKVNSIQQQIKSHGAVAPSMIQSVAARKKKFVESVSNVLAARSYPEDISFIFSGSLIDLHASFSSLRYIEAGKKDTVNGESSSPGYLQLATEIPKEMQHSLLHVLSAAEKAFAKRSNKRLGTAVDDEEPATDDEPMDDESDAEENAEEVDSKLASTLIAEQQLCDLASNLVMGIWAGVLDGKREGNRDMVRKRLKRNKTRLGANFRSVIEQLEKGIPSAKPPQPKRKTTKPAPKASGKSDAIVIDSDHSENEEEMQQLDDELEELDEGGDDDNDAVTPAAEEAVEEELESVLGD